MKNNFNKMVQAYFIKKIFWVKGSSKCILTECIKHTILAAETSPNCWALTSSSSNEEMAPCKLLSTSSSQPTRKDWQMSALNCGDNRKYTVNTKSKEVQPLNRWGFRMVQVGSESISFPLVILSKEFHGREKHLNCASKT